MAKRDSYSNDELVDLINSEGMENALRHQVNVDFIADDEVRDRWQTAKTALDELADYLQLD